MSGYNTKLALDKQARIDQDKIAIFDGSISLLSKFYINNTEIDVRNPHADDVLTYDISTNRFRPLSGSSLPIYNLADNRIITGMQVTNNPSSKLCFDVSNGIFALSGSNYNYSASTICTMSGDTTERYDLLYIGSGNTIMILSGTGNTIPTIPTNTLGVAIVKIPTGQTSTGSTTPTIYPFNSIFASQVIYNRGDFSNISSYLDANYVYPQITSFTNNINDVEAGFTANTVNVTWLTNKSGLVETLYPTGYTFTPLQGSYTLSGINISGDVISTPYSLNLSFYDGIGTANSTSNINFYNKIYYGNFSGLTITNGQILNLNGGSSLIKTNNNTFSLSGGGNYVYVCYPTRFGTLNLYVFGMFTNDFTITTQSFTNQYGFTENYYVCRSNYIQNGTGIIFETK